MNSKLKISVIGLGYVGLPLALEFAKKYPVIGFDINPSRINMMRHKEDPSRELESKEFEDCNIIFTDDPNDLKQANFHIVAVPTPINEHNQPDLKPLFKACHTVGNIIKKGDYIVFESTVYPGCTEEDCVPILEQKSGLKFKDDFKVGFSPERINPGDKQNTLTNIKKITSGCDEESAEYIAQVYESIIKAGIHRAASIKIAEAAKIIENTQRDINIAFMNELSILFNKLDINTFDVLEAAGTKWNFLKFTPGLVGGHCIGVDPYYLVHKAKGTGYHPQIMTAGRFINDSMGAYIAKQLVKKLLNSGKNLKETKVLVMGVTFKENVSDIRNSKVFDIIKELNSYTVNVDAVDVYASKQEVMKEYNVELTEKIRTKYDAVVMAVNHKEYATLDEEYFKSLMIDNDGIIIDVKGVFKDKIKELNYWSL